MPGWNFADVWEVVADTLPDAPALVQSQPGRPAHGRGGRRQSFAETDRRANGVARALLDLGAGAQDKVAQYLYNCPEYLESVFGTFKAGLVPVNTNYRYGDDELAYLWDNADAVAVVFHGTFAERIECLRPRLPRVKGWLWVDDGSGPCPDWAIAYEDAAKSTSERVAPPWGRSGDDLYLLYTGGTTGMPKGVMWRQDDLFAALNAGAPLKHAEDAGLAGVRATLQGAGPVFLPSCPLMHGTGAFTGFTGLSVGGSVVLLPSRAFDPEELLTTVAAERVNVMSIVGDAFAKPILRVLDESPGRWDISSLGVVLSSGVMWSEPTKQGLLRHHPGMLLVDSFASSEALGMGRSISSTKGRAETARFVLGRNARVIGDDGRDVAAGSGQVGLLAVRGRNPVGYYKDPEKTGRTFRMIDGARYSIPGDHATVDADGTLRVLGRGSVCINTGGEKVFPEEVEEIVKLHPAVRDALVVGVPDERFGEAICAVIEPQPGAAPAPEDVVAHVKGRLASYKAPRHVVVVETIGRAANGKADYERLRSVAAATHGAETPRR
ncbi:MAG: acyl-CoA synthetase [Actinobacteria bacterium]|nr:MAG: acyl-CoA synthetase [Actinomycetota bacterium]